MPFDVYTSYDLRWFPYELINCTKLKDSRVSTRAVFGNYKNRKLFPSLLGNPVMYDQPLVTCSICKKEMTYTDTNQLWISVKVGTDVLPLLANLCSADCKAKLPTPEPGYVPFPHKGGLELKQPSNKEWEEIMRAKATQQRTVIDNNKIDEPKPGLFKVIKKIWD